MPMEGVALTLCSIPGPPICPWKCLAQCADCVRQRIVAPIQCCWRPDDQQHKKGLMVAGYRRSFLRAMNVIDLFPFLAGNKMPFKNKAKGAELAVPSV